MRKPEDWNSMSDLDRMNWREEHDREAYNAMVHVTAVGRVYEILEYLQPDMLVTRPEGAFLVRYLENKIGALGSFDDWDADKLLRLVRFVFNARA